MQSPRTSFALLHQLCIAPPWISVGWAKVLLYAAAQGDWNDVCTESTEMELVLQHFQGGMLSKSGSDTEKKETQLLKYHLVL